MASAEKRDGKLTGWWYGEKVLHKGKPDQKRFRRRFDTKKDAEGYEVYVGLTGTEPPGIADNTTATTGRSFKMVAQECKEAGGPDGKWKRGKDPSVIQRLEYSCGAFDKPEDMGVIGALDIAEVGPKAFKKVRESLEKRPAAAGRKLSGSTINRYMSAISAVLTYAINEEYIEMRAKTPLKAEQNKQRDVLRSYEQEQAVLSWLTQQGHAIDAFLIEVLVTAGARRGEFFKLQPYQVLAEEIDFSPEQTKTDEARVVWIGEDRATRLRAIIAAGAMPNGFQLLRRFKAACKACGYKGNLVLHSLRHTRNTRLRKEGVDIKVRMQMLGQKSMVTSMRYDHVDTQDQLEAAKKVEKARGETAPKGEITQMADYKKRLQDKALEATSGIEPECTVLQTEV